MSRIATGFQSATAPALIAVLDRISGARVSSEAGDSMARVAKTVRAAPGSVQRAAPAQT